MTARPDELPAASNARMEMALVPTNRGMFTDQAVVPDAVPVVPAEVVHFTESTPTASLAVPLIEMVAADVETMVVPGLAIRRDGAVVSFAAGAEAGGSVGVVGGATGVVVGGGTGVVAGGSAGVVTGG